VTKLLSDEDGIGAALAAALRETRDEVEAARIHPTEGMTPTAGAYAIEENQKVDRALEALDAVTARIAEVCRVHGGFTTNLPVVE